MAELVDALGSGPSGSNTVQVRILFWAWKADLIIGSAFLLLSNDRSFPISAVSWYSMARGNLMEEGLTLEFKKELTEGLEKNHTI